MVRPSGFEPPTFCSGGFQSHHESTTYLHYGPIRSSNLSTVIHCLTRFGGGFGGVVSGLCSIRPLKSKISDRLGPLGYEPKLGASPSNPGAPTPFNSRNRVTPSYLEPRADGHTNGHTQRPIPRLSRPPPLLLRLQLDLLRVLHNGGLREAMDLTRPADWPLIVSPATRSIWQS